MTRSPRAFSVRLERRFISNLFAISFCQSSQVLLFLKSVARHIFGTFCLSTRNEKFNSSFPKVAASSVDRNSKPRVYQDGLPSLSIVLTLKLRFLIIAFIISVFRKTSFCFPLKDLENQLDRMQVKNLANRTSLNLCNQTEKLQR